MSQCVVNGSPYAFSDRSQLLVDFLHEHGLVGTKLSCGQGGCGACTVSVQLANEQSVKAVNACLRPMGLLENANVRKHTHAHTLTHSGREGEERRTSNASTCTLTMSCVVSLPSLLRTSDHDD